MLAMKKMKKKLFVYAGVAASKKASKKGRAKAGIQWIVKDVREFKAKRGKLSVAPVKGKGVVAVKTQLCGCSEVLAPGEQFIFVSKSGIRKNKLSLDGDYFVIPVSETEEIGKLFKSLVAS